MVVLSSKPRAAEPFSSSISDAPPSIASNGKPSKASSNHSYLDTPLQSEFARSSDTISDISIYSADNENERRTGRLLTATSGVRLPSRSPAPPRTWKGKIEASWVKNKGLALVMISQLFGVMMNVTTRLLEMDGSHGPGMHPFQILFARMTCTLVLSGTYQWLAKVEHAPFGPRGIWKLLIARGVGGFFGVYGMYCENRTTYRLTVSLVANQSFERLTRVPAFVRRNCYHLPRANCRLLGLLCPAPRALHT